MNERMSPVIGFIVFMFFMGMALMLILGLFEIVGL